MRLASALRPNNPVHVAHLAPQAWAFGPRVARQRISARNAREGALGSSWRQLFGPITRFTWPILRPKRGPLARALPGSVFRHEMRERGPWARSGSVLRPNNPVHVAHLAPQAWAFGPRVARQRISARNAREGALGSSWRQLFGPITRFTWPILRPKRGPLARALPGSVFRHEMRERGPWARSGSVLRPNNPVHVAHLAPQAWAFGPRVARQRISARNAREGALGSSWRQLFGPITRFTWPILRPALTSAFP